MAMIPVVISMQQKGVRIDTVKWQENCSKAKEAYDAAIDKIEAPTEAERPIILSGKHTFETQTRHVVTGLADLSEARWLFMTQNSVR